MCGSDGGCGCAKGALDGYEFGQVTRGPWRGTQVSGLIGKVVIFEACGHAPVLLRLSDIEYVRALDNFLYVSRLAGQVIWGDAAFSGVDIDNREMTQARGWAPIQRMEKVLMGVPKTRRQVYYRRFEMGTLEAGDHSFATVTAVSGALDLISNIPTDWDVRDDAPECEAIITLHCESLFCQESCDRVREDGVLVDCTCPQSFDENPIGFCWLGTRASCQPVNCRRPKRCVVRFYHRCICA